MTPEAGRPVCLLHGGKLNSYKRMARRIFIPSLVKIQEVKSTKVANRYFYT